jgi:hypothetical protein
MLRRIPLSVQPEIARSAEGYAVAALRHRGRNIPLRWR